MFPHQINYIKFVLSYKTSTAGNNSTHETSLHTQGVKQLHTYYFNIFPTLNTIMLFKISVIRMQVLDILFLKINYLYLFDSKQMKLLLVVLQTKHIVMSD